jgi:Tol biopolymer transport system component
VISDEITIISLDTSDRGANGASTSPSVDRDGDMIAFESTATNIDPLSLGDNGSTPDIFIHDRSGSGDPTNTIISLDTIGEGANGASTNPSINADGRFVAFQSTAADLVNDVLFDNGDISDIFVHDISTGITEIITLDINGEGTNGDSTDPSISSDGRFVAYRSFASDAVENDTNGQADIFVHDRQENTTVRINVDRSGNQALAGTSDSPTISINGGFVAFNSLASNLVSSDRNNSFDVFVTPNSLIQ